jgi:hypothetical protein
MMKTVLLVVGILWSGGLLTAQVFKLVDLGTNRDFFLGVFGASATTLGLTKPGHKSSSEPESTTTPTDLHEPFNPDYDP